MLLLLAAACGHGAHQGREDEDCNSAAARVPVLIAQGEYAQAQALLAELLKAGLVTQVQAEHWRRQLDERRAAPERRPPPVSPRDPELDQPPEEEAPTCRTRHPEQLLCRVLPDEYTFTNASLALEALKQRLGEKQLKLHNREPTVTGPCPGNGDHYNVRLNGQRMGSITCCPCCVDMAAGPRLGERCRIVW